MKDKLDGEGSSVEERTEQVNAIDPDAGAPDGGTPAQPRPVDASEPQSPREEAVEPGGPGQFDELGQQAAGAGVPALTLPEPKPLPEPLPEPPAEPVPEEGLEPHSLDLDAPIAAEALAAPEQLLPEPKPLPEPLAEPAPEKAVMQSPTAPELPEPPPEPLGEAESEPDLLVNDLPLPAEAPPEPELAPALAPDSFPEPPAEPEHAVSSSEPAVQRPLHERIPEVLPSVALHLVSPAGAVPLFEAPPRPLESPRLLEDNPAVATPRDVVAEPRAEILAEPRAEILAVPRPAALAPTWPELAPPSRPLSHALASYLRQAVRLAAFAAMGAAVLVLALIVLYRWVNPPVSTLMLGQWLTGTKVTKRWVPIDRISPYLHRAVITAEDGRFCQHRGVDWEEIEIAIERARDGIPRGGSTISMQVVKNLFLWPSKSYVRKAIEIPLTYAIEVAWPKRRILEIYLNIAEWGPGVFGAEAAARYHFGKPAGVLTPGQAALLAVALPNPLERRAGAPGPGMQRLAATISARMRASSGNAACIGSRG